MIEQPVIPRDPRRERAIINADSFLMHRGNQEFLSGSRPRPVLPSVEGKVLVVILGWLGVVITAVVLSFLTLSLVENALWLAQALLLVFCISPFVAFGWGMWWLNRRYHQPMAGQVLQGEVVHAEKIRTVTTRGNRFEELQVQYQFVDPLGAVVTGNSKASVHGASRDMAPDPGTGVYIWLTPEGKHYLL
jgi:hypothetical protein